MADFQSGWVFSGKLAVGAGAAKRWAWESCIGCVSPVQEGEKRRIGHVVDRRNKSVPFAEQPVVLIMKA